MELKIGFIGPNRKFFVMVFDPKTTPKALDQIGCSPVTVFGAKTPARGTHFM